MKYESHSHRGLVCATSGSGQPQKNILKLRSERVAACRTPTPLKTLQGCVRVSNLVLLLVPRSPHISIQQPKTQAWIMLIEHQLFCRANKGFVALW